MQGLIFFWALKKLLLFPKSLQVNSFSTKECYEELLIFSEVGFSFFFFCVINDHFSRPLKTRKETP